RLTVVGGGAGGVELALSAQHRLAPLIGDGLDVTLVTREALLPSHNAGVRRLFERILTERRIKALTGREIVRIEPGVLIGPDGERVEFDEALWVTEAGAAPLPPQTGPPLTPHGLTLVENRLRATRDPRIFAAGAGGATGRRPRERAGV